ncbi:MAG: flagellar biosynthesis protein FliQ [Deltaproteobacteria bacterium]|nr:flagellar biosynthesis protein FliQ [Deltaproteobacteria bacterium]NCP02717.1 flagellar biosynthesis protein FliQ [Deltaproteobacteria bacterium]NCP77583.1 flagellar biosynthesis protein FliQ [Desulfuromonadales bacterium]
MTPEFVIDIGRRALETALLISAPMLLTALLVGLIISIFQAATQINEQTMTFIPKIVGVFVVLLIFAPWILQKMMTLTLMIFDLLPTLGR